MAKRDDLSIGETFRSAEKKLTKGLIKWKFKRDGLPTPDEKLLDDGSERIVDEAHNIVKRRGKTILEELRQAKKEFLKAYRDEEE